MHLLFRIINYLFMGNGHATTYRALLQALAARGHEVLFLERDVPWYSQNRDCHELKGVRIALHPRLDDLRERFADEIAEADAVVVGSYVPEGVAVGNLVLATAQSLKAFFVIDTPVTLAKLQQGDGEYLVKDQIPQYDLVLALDPEFAILGTPSPSSARLRQISGQFSAVSLCRRAARTATAHSHTCLRNYAARSTVF